jgi:hypothetical protein
LERQQAAEAEMIGFHPDYGLPDELRLAAIKDAEIIGVKQSAVLHRVSEPSIYKWRKVLGEKT